MKKAILTAALILMANAAQAMTLQCSNQLGQIFTANITQDETGIHTHTIVGLLKGNNKLVELKGTNEHKRSTLSFNVTDASGQLGTVDFKGYYPPTNGGCKRCGPPEPDYSQEPKMYWGLINYANQNIHLQCNPLPN